MPCDGMIYQVNFDANQCVNFEFSLRFLSLLTDSDVPFHDRAPLVFFLSRTEISAIVLNFGPRLSRFRQDSAEDIAQ